MFCVSTIAPFQPDDNKSHASIALVCKAERPPRIVRCSLSMTTLRQRPTENRSRVSYLFKGNGMCFIIVAIHDGLLVNDRAGDIAAFPDVEESGPVVTLLRAVCHRLQSRQPATGIYSPNVRLHTVCYTVMYRLAWPCAA